MTKPLNRTVPPIVPTAQYEDGTVLIVGGRKRDLDTTRKRITGAAVVICLGFLVVLARLFFLGSAEVADSIDGRVLNAVLASRPTIIDRNGITMALDIRVPSLFAEPRRIIDIEEAAQAVHSVLPDLGLPWLRSRLDGTSGFAWIARELSPQKQHEIMRQGIPGLDFLTETKRFYPAFNEAAHILGAVNVDNGGIAGIEHHIDGARDLALLHQVGLARDTAMEPVRLSIDMRVQHILHTELMEAMHRYRAVAAAGAIMDVHSGEVIALASLPDFDPNQPASMLVDGRFNRMTAAKFEPASIFKTVTIAGALDAGAIELDDQVDASTPVRFGRHSISDYYGKYRSMSVPEVYTFSSNIGTVRIAERLGTEPFRAFLTRMGFDGAPKIELPEVTASSIPARLSSVAAATISFGHGLSVTPMQMLSATAALVNGGYLVTPTLMQRDGDVPAEAKVQVVKPATSAQVRYLMRLNALEGSARRANALAEGYRIGGKTGTAEKVVAGRYSNEKVTTFFSSAFPLDAPRFAMVIMVDEPQSERSGAGRTSAYNAGDMTGRIVSRIGPILGVQPRDWDNIPYAQVGS